MTYTFILLLATFSVLVSQVVPHHHHHGEQTICLLDDLNALESCDHHHSAEDNCCSLKYNLTAYHVDQREEDNCPCDIDHDHHFGHLFAALLLQDAYALPDNEPLPRSERHRPYLDHYLSVLNEGHLGLRAPPVA